MIAAARRCLHTTRGAMAAYATQPSSFALGGALPEALRRAADDASRAALFSLMSYNVLAQCYIDCDYSPDAPPPAFMQREARHTAIQRKIALVSPDLLALQEIEIEHFERDWAAPLALLGYDGVLQDDKTRAEKQLTANATFFRRDAFELIFTQHRSRSLVCGLRARFVPAPAAADVAARPAVQAAAAALASLEATAGAAAKAVKKARDRLARAEGAVLAESIVWLANVHLQGDPMLVEIRLSQLAATIGKGIGAGLEAHGLSVERAPVLVCGDFNDQPDSLVYAFMRTRHVAAGQAAIVGEAVVPIARDYAHAVPLRSCYEAALGRELEFTFFHAKYRSSALDFIWASDNARLACVACGTHEHLAERVARLLQTGLPNGEDDEGSDHLPVAAVLRLLV